MELPEDLAAALVGRYLIEREIGRGGMATVYLARDIRHDRHVAIKVLPSWRSAPPGSDRFQREIAIAAHLTHPNILPLHDSVSTDRVLCYVMPYVVGESLRHRLDREKQLGIDDAVEIARQVAAGLDYAHAQGIIHRDIKPANVLLVGEQAMIADFGLARQTHVASYPPVTEVGVALGTPGYMSPEQAAAERDVDGRADIYSLGCVLFEMIAGSPPFRGPSAQALLTQHATRKPPSLCAERESCPPDIDAIAQRAMAKIPADRFRTAGDMMRALAQARAAVPPPRARSRRWRGAVAIAAVPAIALGAWTWSRAGAHTSSGGERANVAADPARVAVLPFENLTADSSLAYVANGITTDLIDELAQVGALTVVSKNGVLPYVGKSIGLDSMARALRVGSIITGDVRRAGNGVSVSVRLIDGITGQQLASRDTSAAMQDVLSVRSSVVEDVTRFLRRRLGEQVRVSAGRRRASSALAWELVERVRVLRTGELTQSYKLSSGDRALRFQHADSLASVAARLDTKWSGPLTERAMLATRQAAEEMAALSGPGRADDGREIARRLWREAVTRCDEALARDTSDAEALRVRGNARMELWRTSRDGSSDSLRIRAEADLRAAVDRRPDLSPAWSDLSTLLGLGGDFAAAEEAATEALKADEYLSNAPEVLARLQFSALGAEQTENAAHWCAEGRRRYPDDPRFFACELTTLGWTASRPADVARAWAVLDAAEKRYSADVLVSGWATRRLFVAAVAARAGLHDSALAIVARTRAGVPTGVPGASADYGEAHVRALLGQRDDALRLIGGYLRQYPIQRRQVARMPWFRSLRDDPRFIEMTTTR